MDYPLFVASLVGCVVFALVLFVGLSWDHPAPLWFVKNIPNRLRGAWQELLTMGGIGVVSELRVTKIDATGKHIPLGVVSRRVVTTAGAAAIVDAFQNGFELENFNYHDTGTGATAEAVGDTGLVTPTGAARITGTQSEPAATQYRTTATVPYTSTLSITEHGLFSAAVAGTLFDRSVFTAIPVNNGDSVQFTYTLTVNAGG